MFAFVIMLIVTGRSHRDECRLVENNAHLRVPSSKTDESRLMLFSARSGTTTNEGPKEKVVF